MEEVNSKLERAMTFADLDQDGDGEIDRDEWDDFLNKYDSVYEALHAASDMGMTLDLENKDRDGPPDLIEWAMFSVNYPTVIQALTAAADKGLIFTANVINQITDAGDEAVITTLNDLGLGVTDLEEWKRFVRKYTSQEDAVITATKMGLLLDEDVLELLDENAIAESKPALVAYRASIQDLIADPRYQCCLVNDDVMMEKNEFIKASSEKKEKKDKKDKKDEKDKKDKKKDKKKKKKKQLSSEEEDEEKDEEEDKGEDTDPDQELEEVIARYFHRYDLDGSGSINRSDQCVRLTYNTFRLPLLLISFSFVTMRSDVY